MKYFLLVLLFLGSNICLAKPPIFIESYEDAKVIAKQVDQPMILIFSASWCPHCLKLKQDITDNTEEFPDTTICIVDVDDNEKLTKEFKVKKIPKIVMFDNKGKQIKEITGYSNLKALK
jgi:thioredoxin-related protein